MKKFENKTTQVFDVEKQLKYSHLAIACMNNFIQGETRIQMKKSNDLIDKLESFHDKDSIELETAEHELLMKFEKSFAWKFRHKDIVAFGEALDKAE